MSSTLDLADGAAPAAVAFIPRSPTYPPPPDGPVGGMLGGECGCIVRFGTSRREQKKPPCCNGAACLFFPVLLCVHAAVRSGTVAWLLSVGDALLYSVSEMEHCATPVVPVAAPDSVAAPAVGLPRRVVALQELWEAGLGATVTEDLARAVGHEASRCFYLNLFPCSKVFLFPSASFV
jgi:hypothetical protein